MISKYWLRILKFYFFLLANKTGCKTIEDWVCPTAKLHPDTRKRSDISLNSDPHGSLKSGENLGEPNHHVVATVPLHLILIIIACILVVLVFVGCVSYYEALRT